MLGGAVGPPTLQDGNPTSKQGKTLLRQAQAGQHLGSDKATPHLSSRAPISWCPVYCCHLFLKDISCSSWSGAGGKRPLFFPHVWPLSSLHFYFFLWPFLLTWSPLLFSTHVLAMRNSTASFLCWNASKLDTLFHRKPQEAVGHYFSIVYTSDHQAQQTPTGWKPNLIVVSCFGFFPWWKKIC